jgi:hypothetical protein
MRQRPAVGSSACRHHHRSASSRRHPPTPTEPQFDAQRLRPRRHRTGAQNGGHTQGICALVMERTLSRHMPCGWESLLRLRGRLLGSAPASDPCAPVTRFWVRPGEGKRNPRMVTRQARQRASPLIKNSGAAGRAGRGLTLPGALAGAAAVAACRRAMALAPREPAKCCCLCYGHGPVAYLYPSSPFESA